MIDGTDYWFPLVLIVGLAWIVLARIDPMKK